MDAWYPKQFAKITEERCWVCNGTGSRNDAKTDLKRTCVACGGTGLIKITKPKRK